jgi:two-component system, chemotaxis family, chemotaxis protein CheY
MTPANDPAPMPDNSIPIPPSVRLESLSVLVVDDSRSLLMMLEGQLKCKGFGKIVLVPNGLEALAKVKCEKIDVILCDWDMPVMDGMQLLNELKTDPDTKDIPFLLVTSKSNRSDILNAIKKGVDDYIVKPIQINVLVKKVIDMVQKRQSRKQD